MPTNNEQRKVQFDYKELATFDMAAERENMSFSNYIRSLLGLPPFNAGGPRPGANTRPDKKPPKRLYRVTPFSEGQPQDSKYFDLKADSFDDVAAVATRKLSAPRRKAKFHGGDDGRIGRYQIYLPLKEGGLTAHGEPFQVELIEQG